VGVIYTMLSQVPETKGKDMKSIGLRITLILALASFLSACPRPPQTKAEPAPQNFSGPLVYLESDRIGAFFEVQNLEEYQRLIPKIFKIPERALCQVSFVDNYRMENGPVYLLSSISILVSHEGTLGWYILTMPETHEEPVRRGVSSYGYPKVVRKVTLEGRADKYIGTSYRQDGKTVEFKLTLEAKKAALGPEEKQFYDFIAPFPSLTVKNGRVYRFGGGKTPIYHLQKTAPNVWKIKMGEGSVEHPDDPGNLLKRMDVGKCLTGFWGNLKYRSMVKPIP
jgi:hypothetical protein